MAVSSVKRPAVGAPAWRLFAYGVVCQACAGHVYWFPAIGQGVQEALSFSAPQLTALLAAVNSGSWLGFIGGVLYARIGARRTTMLGATISAACYALLATLVAMRATGRVVFLTTVLAALVLVTTCFFVYSTSMAVVAAQFPPTMRGRVMAFHAAMFGMSAGVFGLLQDAFAASVADTTRALAGAAVLAFLPALIALVLFPEGKATEMAASRFQEESVALLPSRVAAASEVSDAALLSTAFVLALSVVGVLQTGVYLTWSRAAPVTIPLLFSSTGVEVRPQVLCALVLLVLLGSFLLLPIFASQYFPYEEQAMEEAPATPFKQVLGDVRYRLILLAMFILPGSTAMGTLVNLNGVVASRLFTDYAGKLVPQAIGTGETVASAVRALVIAFSSGSLFGRLATVLYADARGGTVAWKMRLLEIVALVMAAAASGVAIGHGATLVAAVATVGAAHGTFFALSPPLVSGWFGVDGFPLNFAVCGVPWAVATVTIASTLPAFLAGLVERTSWVELAVAPGFPTVERFCAGTLCYATTFAFVASLCVALAVTFHLLHRRVVNMST